jgi:2-phospho-L-lactate guanylyltransferase
MLGDVLAAVRAVAETRVVTGDAEGAAVARAAGAAVVDDPGGGQGAAVAAALDGVEPGAILIVNADLPCVVPGDLHALLAAAPPGGFALVEAPDGTTNALCVPAREAFSSLYGPGSAARFRAHAERLGLHVESAAVPNLADDVDTLDDLRRLSQRLGPRSRTALAALPVAVGT